MNKKEAIIGAIVLILLLVLGGTFLASSALFFRLVIGLGLGYALTRSSMGFAGSVNRAYTTGSTKLLRALMLMFVITAAVTVAFIFNGTEGYSLWVRQINLGVILGGLLFGFGMTFSSCCASGVLTDLVTALPRALITLLFFGMGVFLGFPIQKSASWVTGSWINTTDFKGVFFPDLFKWDGLNGYLGAMVVTIVLALIVVAFSYRYENKRKAEKTFTGVECEVEQYTEEKEDEKITVLSEAGYKKAFVKPWTLGTGAVVISGLFALLMGVTGSGWGASTPYGHWFGKILKVFGVSSASLETFTKQAEGTFDMAFFSNPVYVQNFGIVLGTLVCLLLAGKFTKVFTSELKITFKDAVLFAIGGLLMGFGTRLSNGCNVGALYTPIANFSLSGWMFLFFLIAGGVIGNMVAKKIKK